MNTQKTLRIEPTQGIGKLGFRELWEYRDLLWFQILKEVKGKYRQMALGPLWIILQPIVQMLVLSIVFGKIAKLNSDGIPYPILTFTALIPWTFFTNATQLSSSCLVSQMGVISKVYFPRLILPLSYTIGRLIDFFITFSILMIMLMMCGYTPEIRWLMVIPYMFLAIMTTIGISTWTASLAVRFRDVKFLIQYGLQTMMYLTPVAYVATNLPEQWLWLLKLNPMFYVIEGFRWSLLGIGQGPEGYMLYPILLVLLLNISGVFLFRKTERTIVDLL